MAKGLNVTTAAVIVCCNVSVLFDVLFRLHTKVTSSDITYNANSFFLTLPFASGNDNYNAAQRTRWFRAAGSTVSCY